MKIAGLVLLLVVAACAGSPASAPSGASSAEAPGSGAASSAPAHETPSPGPSQPATSSTAGAGAGSASHDVLASFDTERLGRSLARLNARILRDPEGVRVAAAELLASSDDHVRFGALYALRLTARPGPSLEAVRPFLSSTDPTERLLAAETLATRGEEDAIPVLIEALGSRDQVRNWHPYREVWQKARRVLLLVTDQDLGLRGAVDAPSAAAAQRAWRAWWEDNASTFQLDTR